MDLKEFLKPDKSKIISTIIFTLIAYYIIHYILFSSIEDIISDVPEKIASIINERYTIYFGIIILVISPLMLPILYMFSATIINLKRQPDCIKDASELFNIDWKEFLKPTILKLLFSAGFVILLIRIVNMTTEYCSLACLEPSIYSRYLINDNGCGCNISITRVLLQYLELIIIPFLFAYITYSTVVWFYRMLRPTKTPEQEMKR